MTRTAKHTQSDQIEVKTILNIPRQAVSQADIESFNDFLELLARESSINVLEKPNLPPQKNKEPTAIINETVQINLQS